MGKKYLQIADPNDPKYQQKTLTRLMSYVTKRDDGCWLFEGTRNVQGYGQIGFAGKLLYTHRLMYTLTYGETIEPGMFIDHICHEPAVCPSGKTCPHRRCINPAHLRLVTHKENCSNSRRVSGIEKAWSKQAGKTHCPRGHEYNRENTALAKGVNMPTRFCRMCRKINMDNYLRRHSLGKYRQQNEKASSNF